MPRLIRLINCESRGNPLAYNRGGRVVGLFQHKLIYWPQRSAAAGIPGANPWQAYPNIMVGVWLYVTEGRSHWANC